MCGLKFKKFNLYTGSIKRWLLMLFALSSLSVCTLSGIQAEQSEQTQTKQSIYKPIAYSKFKTLEKQIKSSSKIVGGNIVDRESWPWMSSLVTTFNGQAASVSIAGEVLLNARVLTGSISGNETANLVDCGFAASRCSNMDGNICLIERGPNNENAITFSEKVANCVDGGGVAAVIYNHSPGSFRGTLLNTSFNIPAVGITREDGLLLKQRLDQEVNVFVSKPDQLLQRSFCAGSVIGDRWVLTAAHCVDDLDLNSFMVNVGEFDLRDGAEAAIAVKEVYLHPDWNSVFLNNDLALIELKEAVDVEPILLADTQLVNEFINLDFDTIAIGWGDRQAFDVGEERDALNFPDLLHQVELNLMSNSQCSNEMTETLRSLGELGSAGIVSITDAMICAGFDGGGRGTCQGDSGGPLMVNSNGVWYQVGISSWGFACAQEGLHSVFAKPASALDWINSILKNVSIQSKHEFDLTPEGRQNDFVFRVNNNLSHSVSLFSKIEEDFESNYTIVDDTCDDGFLDVNEECFISVRFSPNSGGRKLSRLQLLDTNSNQVIAESTLDGMALARAPEFSGYVVTESDVEWFTGGDKSWEFNQDRGGIRSGDIDDGEKSFALAIVDGPGSLTLNWSVSSEDCSDSPEQAPCDPLVIYLDNEQYNFIQGETDFSEITINYDSTGEHFILFSYEKDRNTSRGQDRGFLKDLSSGEPSGGSLGLGVLLLLMGVWKLRRTSHY